MNVAGEILQHKNKKAPFIASFLAHYGVFVFKLRQMQLLRLGKCLIKHC